MSADILFEIDEGIEIPSSMRGFDLRDTAVSVAAAVLDELSCPYDAVIDLLITGNDEIREVNRESRGIDEPTDVLSFPAVSIEPPGDFSSITEGDPSFFDMESGRLMLGDIIVNIDRAALQAEEYGHSARREFAFLIAHSVLHLSGFDHIEEEDAEEMFAMQDTILERLGITREIQQ